jgi:uncharacterized membrane protein YfcA
MKFKPDIIKLKKGILSSTGLVLGLISSLTGIGAQTLSTPTIEFLLGFPPEKNAATSLAFSFFCAASATAAVLLLHHIPISFTYCFLLTLGATVGALLSRKQSMNPRFKHLRQIAHSAAFFLAVFTLREALANRIGGIVSFTPDWFTDHKASAAILIGLGVGFLSSLFEISGGILFVPALIFFSPVFYQPPSAIYSSLYVVTLASIIPLFSYSTAGLIDQSSGRFMAAGGILGGILGGVLVSIVLPAIADVVLYSIAAILICAWSMYRIYNNDLKPDR